MKTLHKNLLIAASLFLLAGAGCTQPAATSLDTDNANETVVNTTVTNANESVVENINAVLENENTTTSNTNDSGAETTDTSDWLTYTNEEYGFSFRYPKTYFVSISKSTKADFIDDDGVVFMIGRKITDSQIDPVRITLYDHIVEHPTADDINSVAFAEGPNKVGQSFDHVISETSYFVKQYYGKIFRVKDLSGTYPVDENHKLKDVAEYYYIDSNIKTVEIRLTDEAATGVDADGLLNSLQF